VAVQIELHDGLDIIDRRDLPMHIRFPQAAVRAEQWAEGDPFHGGVSCRGLPGRLPPGHAVMTQMDILAYQLANI
jgi:hypothetical protein